MRWSMLLWMVATVVAAGLYAGLPARADTVFSNYTGINNDYGVTGLTAEAFTPTANFDFTGAAADFAAGTPPLRDHIFPLHFVGRSAGRATLVRHRHRVAGSRFGVREL
jgi:hypothetical protein